jgi:Uma2 family endonuclease
VSAAEKYVPRYTVSDHRTWEGDWELWAGAPVAMTPSPFGRHQSVLTRLAYLLLRDIEQRECDASVIFELDWVVFDDTVVRPDLVIVCGPPPERHIETPPAVVAEVISDASSRRDSIYKRDLYDEQGVGVYLLVDPENETLQVYHRNEGDEWTSVFVDSSIEIKLCEHCVIDVQKSELFAGRTFQ